MFELFKGKNKNDENEKFSMIIEDAFSVKGSITVAGAIKEIRCIVVGKVQSGTINVNDTVQTMGVNNKIITMKVLRIEKFKKPVRTAKAGDPIGILLKNVGKSDIKIGETLFK